MLRHEVINKEVTHFVDRMVKDATFAVKCAIEFLEVPEIKPGSVARNSDHKTTLVSIKRYVCWTAYLLRYHGKTGHVEPVPLPGAPFSHYYSQEASDEGIIMETDVTVKERKDLDTEVECDGGGRSSAHCGVVRWRGRTLTLKWSEVEVGGPLHTEACVME
uniref:(California timema) hypothetical protein n=1 Tax=Timema californicum TaxID=61474 RepID=A0A7R9J5K8_TIMCA|nr:unnamed protein product [Timema californicum]